MLRFKLTPINDAYQGPYKTRYRWWTGIMLLVRTILVVFFTLNIFGNQRLNLLFIVTVCVIILALMWNIGTVYKNWWVNIIESFFIGNLVLLAAWCEYNRQTSSNYIRDQSIIAYLLVGSALTVFVVIATTRVIMRVKVVIVKYKPPKAHQLLEVPLEDLTGCTETAPAVGTRAPPTVTCTYIDFKHTENDDEIRA